MPTHRQTRHPKPSHVERVTELLETAVTDSLRVSADTSMPDWQRSVLLATIGARVAELDKVLAILTGPVPAPMGAQCTT
jgi:hypothetical protein